MRCSNPYWGRTSYAQVLVARVLAAKSTHYYCTLRAKCSAYQVLKVLNGTCHQNEKQKEV
jgi:hypothetical protein